MRPRCKASKGGHKTNREGMTLGTYLGGPPMEQRRQCVEAVKLLAQQPFRNQLPAPGGLPSC